MSQGVRNCAEWFPKPRAKSEGEQHISGKGCSEVNNGMELPKFRSDMVCWSLSPARVEKSQHLMAGLGIKMRHEKSPCKGIRAAWPMARQQLMGRCPNQAYVSLKARKTQCTTICDTWLK